MPRNRRAQPSSRVIDWPDVASDDPTVEVARLLAIGLREAMAGRSAREVAKICGLNQSTVSAVLNGTVWPDIYTTVLLEDGLGVNLWPLRGTAGQRAS